MMVFAVMSRLFPQPHLRRPLQARIRFGAFNVGLLGMVAGLLTNGEWYSIPGALLAIACIWYGLEFIPVLWEFSQSADRSIAFLIAAWICLGIVACLGLWFGIVSPSATSLNLQLQFVYGFLYMFGWLTFMIFGMLYRIIPTHISKFLSTRGISAAGIRGAFIASSLQLLVFVCLLAGVALCCYRSSARMPLFFALAGNMADRRLGIYGWSRPTRPAAAHHAAIGGRRCLHTVALQEWEFFCWGLEL
jgi:hypothetical protein